MEPPKDRKSTTATKISTRSSRHIEYFTAILSLSLACLQGGYLVALRGEALQPEQFAGTKKLHGRKKGISRKDGEDAERGRAGD